MFWYIILFVLLGLSTFLNIELWSLCKELKTELKENDGNSTVNATE